MCDQPNRGLIRGVGVRFNTDECFETARFQAVSSVCTMP
jgi:hypothetical protein